ncbi:MAG: hypothetical protein L0H96_06505 [Humibacillus sp.]|nr:hypothetical protein [Humibacillus sp.]MDN5776544.1 hypothetical protein [Humibacillus sp.]
MPSLTPTTVTPGPRRPRGAQVAVWACCAALVGGGAALLVGAETPVGDLAIYGAFAVFGVVLPGTVVHKSLRGTQGSWLEDLALGSATGLALGLPAWMLTSLLNLRGLLWLWPAVTLFCLVRRGPRRRVLEVPTARWAAGPSVFVALAAAAAAWQLNVAFVSVSELPPTDLAYYPDLLWHLGLSNEAVRAFPLETPQLVDAGLLRYHWFSNAHLALTSLMTGIDVPTIMLRLWVLPFGVLFVVLTAALTMKVSSRPWAAAGAAWISVPMVTVPFWPEILPRLDHLSGNSPSQLFAYPVVLLTLNALVDVVRGAPAGRGMRRGALMVALLGALACTGAKASALPVVVGGLALVLVVSMLQRRRRMLLLALPVSGTALTGAALLLVNGGDSGSDLQLFSSLTLLTPYRQLVTEQPRLDTLLPVGLFAGPGPGPLLFVALVLAVLLVSLRSLAFVLPLLQRRLRDDPAAWLLAGTCLASFVPFLTIGHPGYSEYYFLHTTIPVGSALWMWSLAEGLDSSGLGSRTVVRVMALGALSTIALGAWSHASSGPLGDHDLMVVLVGFVTVVGVVGSAVVGAVSLNLARRNRIRGRPRWPAALLVAVVLSPVLGSGVLEVATAGADSAVAAPDRSPAVLDETTTALWLAHHVPQDAVLATNVHCLPAPAPGCDSRQYWISGLGGRRVLIESWGYVPERAAAGGSGHDDSALLALNQSAFTAPTATVLGRLQRMGVTWLVGERRPGEPVSNRLDALADRRYTHGAITVWQLR